MPQSHEQRRVDPPSLGNLEKLRRLFPGCVTEARDEETDQLRLAVDFDQLRQEVIPTCISYTNLHKLEAMCPRACAEGSDAFGLGGKLVPGQGAVVEDVLIAGEDPIGEPVVP